MLKNSNADKIMMRRGMWPVRLWIRVFAHALSHGATGFHIGQRHRIASAHGPDTRLRAGKTGKIGQSKFQIRIGSANRHAGKLRGVQPTLAVQ
jgi:hypothetical protein